MSFKQDWANFSGLDSTGACVACTGGFRDGYVARASDLDLDNWTVGANGISAIALLPGAQLRRFKPVPTDNTTITANGTRADEFAPLNYPFEITGDFFSIGNDFARDMERFACECDLVFFGEDNCCNLVVIGLQYVTGCSATPVLQTILTSLRVTTDNLNFGTKNSSKNNIVTLSGTSTCRELYLDQTAITWADIQALAA